MKRFSIFLCAWLITLLGGNRALNAASYVLELTDAATLSALTEAKTIAIRGIHKDVYPNGFLYNGGTKAFDAAVCLFTLEPVAGQAGHFYLRHEGTEGENNYMQTTGPKKFGAKDGADTFYLTTVGPNGSDATKWVRGNVPTEIPSANVLRFVSDTDGKWWRFGGKEDIRDNNSGEIGDFTVFVVYLYKEAYDITFEYRNADGSIVLGSKVQPVGKNSVITPPVVPGFVEVVSTTVPNGATATADATYSVNTRMKDDCPMLVSASTDDATAQWMSFALPRNPSLKVFASADDLVHTQNVAATKDTYKYYQWCLTGDWLNGFYITNRATGKAIYDTGTTHSVGGAARPQMGLTDDEGLKQRFELVQNGAGNYFFKVAGTAQKYISNAGGAQNTVLSYWDSANAISDNGGNGDGGSIFSIIDVQQDAVNALKTEYLLSENCVGGYTSADLEGINAISTFDAWEAFTTALAAKDPIVLDPTRYYRIRNAARDLSVDNLDHFGQGAYMGMYPSSNSHGTNQDVACHTKSKAEAAAIWKVEADGDNYRLYCLNAKAYVGKTVTNRGQYVAKATTVADAGTFNIVAWGDVKGSFKLHCTNGAGTDVNLHASGAGVQNYNDNNGKSASGWYLEPADNIEVNLNQAGADYWSSLYLPFAVSLPESIEAYAISATGADYASLAQVTEKAAAEEGLILKAAEAKVSLPILTEEVAKVTGNKLTGTLVATDITDNQTSFYTLGAIEGEVALYHPSGTSLKANRAYLPANTLTAAASLRFDFNVTGIGQIENTTDDNAPCYDLSGRRINKPARGMYISGNKKVIIR